ncbi:5,10-methenyltetrahydrofolate synthetase [Aequorivita sublithincola DSM 14238]|uniref:5-formyltetrahydrofolate cyclo-ligase n=1 Tax=Aequorivita sublithincola (strain DSM 14238 / LMG 21431 / ACAM 643 / 9-3) TaxID=746697 RepID=I3YVF7_AEQSU|nr:5-formyltetrahydrofolate cyclo-ligase [Aequorivita sublithincola]AFL80975.1 5,10-methenyltetrahydrofolate synthetase [Aequorivita sublithincola DSM 14238]
MDKKTLRLKYKKLRETLSEKSIDEMSLQIANQALKLPIWDKTYYHIFLPISSKKEVNTEYLLHILQGKDKSIVISKADFSSGEMQHFLMQENTVLKTSEYGIPEPISGIKLSPEIIDVVFVPLLAFDQNGHRIGYGKGFYDRFLEKCSSKSLFIGLSFFEPEPKIMFESTDVPLNFCVTPEKIFDFKNIRLSLYD